MKADRLLSILLLLRTRGRVPAPELAERLEVSVRTVYRDVEALSAAGVPVWAERGRHGGIHLLPGYRTDVTGLTGDEARALFVLSAQGAHRALGLGDAIGSALRKVMAALPAPYRPDAERTGERILVDPERWRRPGLPVDAVLGTLQSAVLADRRLLLTYRHSGAPEPSRHTVDPYGLVDKAGVWYLVADLDGAPRLFRADRMLTAEPGEEPVHRRPGRRLADVWEGLRAQVERIPDEVTVRVRIRRERLDLVLRIHAGPVPAPVVPVGDGAWHETEFGFGSVRAACTLLAFGADVEVLSPPEARAELLRAATGAAGLYGPPEP